MRNKIIYPVLILLLTCLLLGCSGNVPVIPDVDQKEEIKSVVNNYWAALSNRQYSQAKSYCVINGKFYTMAEEYQNIPYLDSVTTEFSVFVNWVNITGNAATVNTNLTITAIVCFEDICADESETINNFTIELTKNAGGWKLK